MKHLEKQRARELRESGLSYNEILKHINVSKGTLSKWLQDISLTQQQIARLEDKQERRNEAFLESVKQQRVDRWLSYQQVADIEYQNLKSSPLFNLGLGLYIGEGTKNNYLIEISNCNPYVLKKTIEFFELIGGSINQFKCTIHIHENADIDVAKEYWSECLNIPSEQFNKTMVSTTKSSQSKKGNIQPYGCAHIRFNNTQIKQKLLRWMQIALES